MGTRCKVEGCFRDVSSRGFCEMHYRRNLRTGDPGPPGPITRSRGICRIEGCDEGVDAKGLCHGHYQRLLRKGFVEPTSLRKGRSICQIDGCERPMKARGYCAAHYKRVLKHGDPLAHVPIRKARGEGTVAQDGYKYLPVPITERHLTRGAAWVSEHRLVMAKHLGRALTTDEQVHHINGDRADNRLGNLELWSTSHPAGRRIEDLLEFCMAMIERYGAEFGLLAGRD